MSRDLDLRAYANGVTLDFSRPGKPTDNAYIEEFNGRLRAECNDADGIAAADFLIVTTIQFELLYVFVILR